MQPNSQCHNYSSFIWPCESANRGKEKKEKEKMKIIEYLENEKSFLDKNNYNFFYRFWMFSFGKT